MKKICKHHGKLERKDIVNHGNRIRCKICRKLQKKVSYEKNPKKYNAWSKAYRENNKEKIKEYSRSYYIRNREKILKAQSQRKNKDEKKFIKLKKNESDLIHRALFAMKSLIIKLNKTEENLSIHNDLTILSNRLIDGY